MNPFTQSVKKTEQIQIRRHRTTHLIRVYTLRKRKIVTSDIKMFNTLSTRDKNSVELDEVAHHLDLQYLPSSL